MSEFRLSCSVVLQFFFFFLLSHPLYFSSFIFFFPYFLKLLSFLSPLFITTFLLLFSFFSLFLSSSSDHLHPQFVENSVMGFLATTYQVVFDSLRPRLPEEIDEFRLADELEAYRIVFETYTFGSEQSPYGGEDGVFIVPEVEVQVDSGVSVEDFPGKMLDVEVDSQESMENFPGKIMDVEEVASEESMENFPGKISGVEVDSEEWLKNFPKMLDVEVDSEESVENFPGKIMDIEVNSEESMENSQESPKNFPWKILDVKVHSEEKFLEKIMDAANHYAESVKNFPEKTNIFPENPSLNEKLAETKAQTEEFKLKEPKISEKEENKLMKDLQKLTEFESSNSSRSGSSPWSSPGSEYNYSLGSYGSMRKEKEWRRTLACKLFEERHNSEGTEGMDSLWETYEKSESKKLQNNERIKGKCKSKKGKKIDEEDEDEDGDGEGQLCCLQALKFSTGKMNLGTKMAKALKGFGLLSRHGSRKRLIHS